jgi:hypothetical protein
MCSLCEHGNSLNTKASAASMGVQAKQIVKIADRLGIKMGFGYDICVTGVLARNVGEDQGPSAGEDEYRTRLAKSYGLKLRDWNALEAGYENYTGDQALEQIFGSKNITRNRYYKVGRRVGEMVGYH